jgi:hypothetical protein
VAKNEVTTDRLDAFSETAIGRVLRLGRKSGCAQRIAQVEVSTNPKLQAPNPKALPTPNYQAVGG